MDNQFPQVSGNQEFDLTAFEAVDTADLIIKDLKGDDMISQGQRVVFRLRGPGSPEYVQNRREQTVTTNARLLAGMRGKMEDKKGLLAEADRVKKLVACTVSISPNFPLSAEAIYKNPRLGYIADQVAAFVDDWENFSSKPLTK